MQQTLLAEILQHDLKADVLESLAREVYTNPAFKDLKIISKSISLLGLGRGKLTKKQGDKSVQKSSHSPSKQPQIKAKAEGLTPNEAHHSNPRKKNAPARPQSTDTGANNEKQAEEFRRTSNTEKQPKLLEKETVAKPFAEKTAVENANKAAQTSSNAEHMPPLLAVNADAITDLPAVQTPFEPIRLEKGERVAIPNAGVVLLQSYFAHLFKNLELVIDGKFVDQNSQEKAALLLHYLATGESRAWEYNLLLSKLLCGIPSGMPMNADTELSKDEIEEADALMDAAIEH